jgi:hypothetical protein
MPQLSCMRSPPCSIARFSVRRLPPSASSVLLENPAASRVAPLRTDPQQALTMQQSMLNSIGVNGRRVPTEYHHRTTTAPVSPSIPAADAAYPSARAIPVTRSHSAQKAGRRGGVSIPETRHHVPEHHKPPPATPALIEHSIAALSAPTAARRGAACRRRRPHQTSVALSNTASVERAHVARRHPTCPDLGLLPATQSPPMSCTPPA